MGKAVSASYGSSHCWYGTYAKRRRGLEGFPFRHPALRRICRNKIPQKIPLHPSYLLDAFQLVLHSAHTPLCTESRHSRCILMYAKRHIFVFPGHCPKKFTSRSLTFPIFMVYYHTDSANGFSGRLRSRSLSHEEGRIGYDTTHCNRYGRNAAG